MQITNNHLISEVWKLKFKSLELLISTSKVWILPYSNFPLNYSISSFKFQFFKFLALSISFLFPIQKLSNFDSLNFQRSEFPVASFKLHISVKYLESLIRGSGLILDSYHCDSRPRSRHPDMHRHPSGG